LKGEFTGAKVKVIVEDSQAKPDAAVTRAKKLILQDKVMCRRSRPREQPLADRRHDLLVLADQYPVRPDVELAVEHRADGAGHFSQTPMTT
jgi:hypothetical protein